MASLGLALLLGPLPGPVRAASPPDALPAEIMGWKPAGPDRTYDRTAFVRYMKEGEEIFLGYNVLGLTIREYVRSGAPGMTAEVFEMGSPEDAFGLFSTVREGSPETVGNEGLAGPRFIQFWKGARFVRVGSEKETPEARKALAALAQSVSAALPRGGKRPALVSCLPASGIVPGRVTFFHTRATLDRIGFPGDAGPLRLTPQTDAVFADGSRRGQGPQVLLCRYPSDAEAREAFSAILEAYFGTRGGDPGEVAVRKLAKDRFAAGRLTGRVLILVFRSPDRDAARALAGLLDARVRDVFGRPER